MHRYYTEELNRIVPVYSDRIILREIMESEVPGIADIVGYDELMAKSPEDALNIFRMHNEDRRRGESLHLGIALQNSNELIGSCGFYRGFRNSTGEIGYILKEEFRGKGYMSEAVNALLKFGFEILALKKIIAVTDKFNYGSIKVLLKNGFTMKTDDDKGTCNFTLTAAEYSGTQTGISLN